MTMITFRDVSKIYHIGGEEVRALDHASMQIEQGEFVGITDRPVPANLRS